MRKVILIPFFLLTISTFGQQKIDVNLKSQLDSIMLLDQKYREILTLLMDPLQRDAEAKKLSLTIPQATKYYWQLQNHIDSMNVAAIERIFKKYGYPGKTLVGEPANETAWYVIQHSSKIDKHIFLIKKAAEDKELPFILYAKMLDRKLMDNGKEQIYGTQAVCRILKNGSNIGCYIWPIKDAARVNERREKAGFATTVEQNANELDITYRVVTINEVR